MEKGEKKSLRVILKKSLIGSESSQKSAAYGLGLKRVGEVQQFKKFMPHHLGQIRKIRHLISIEGESGEHKKA